MIIRFFCTIIFCFSILIPAKAPAISQNHGKVTEEVETEIAKEVYRLVNAYRNSRGLRSLRIKKELNQIAAKHCKRMAAGQIPFSHQGFSDRVNAVKSYAKVAYSVSENLYTTTSSFKVAEKSLQAWIDSPGHHKNLKGNFLFTGISVVQSRDGSYFVTQIYVGKKS